MPPFATIKISMLDIINSIIDLCCLIWFEMVSLNPMYKVLIVDDEYDIRVSFVRFLPWAESGFVITGQAADGIEAKRFVETHEVDVVFCDIQMPKCTGIDFAAWAYQESKPFIIVFLSAHRKFEFAQEALRYGVRRYLVKPPTLTEFTATLDAIRADLDERRYRTEVSSDSKIETDPIISAIGSYIAGDPANATIKGAAYLVKRSPHYLSTYFKERTGESFTALLLRTKMERALIFLKNRSNTIQEISYMVGYTNSKNFSRAFSAFYGCSPREFIVQRLQEKENEG
jgi:two-component system, response regulator YesN